MKKSTLFRKSSIDKVSSPEQLNDYIRVSNPSVFLILGATLILLIAGVVWGFTGSLPSSISVVGIVKEDNLVCYVSNDKAEQIQNDMLVKMNDEVIGKVCFVSSIPLSAEEVNSSVDSDYVVNLLSLSDWNTKIQIDAQGLEENQVYHVSILTEEIRPIDFLLN
jgi:hypothetical protein